LTKRFCLLTVLIVILLTPALLSAKADNRLDAAGKITVADKTVTVPLVITNQDHLAAMDIPLKFSDGVTLKEVSFQNTRVDYFDFKAAVIDNEKKTVVIGLLPQITEEGKPDLKAGTGPIANLVFEISDPSVDEISLEAVELQSPDHSLLFVYHAYDAAGVPNIVEVVPEFARAALAVTGATVPATFGLSQNYPNPFNPSTNFSYDLPEAADVNLTVYNILGQRVRTLVDQKMEAGTHTVAWDASQYASGVYFYRITAGSFTATKKMLLLK